MSNEEKEQQDKLLELVRSAVQQDEALRDKHQIGEKFRFIRDRLKALLTRVEESIKTIDDQATQKVNTVVTDEILVYVHLYNAQGLVVQTWQKMLTPAVFYEYSVNRPIYTEKGHIDALIRSRPNKVQHAFLTVAIKPTDIYKIPEEQPKDQIGNPLIKVKEGTLKIERLIAFTHNDIEYVLNEKGALVKKEV